MRKHLHMYYMSSEENLSVIMSENDIQECISHLTRNKLQYIGTESWWVTHEKQQLLCRHAIAEADKTENNEKVARKITEAGKIPVLVHEAICISVWREKLFPKLAMEAEKSPTSFLVYMVLYHETSAVCLLEILLYHAEACQELDDSVIDLIDYCTDCITSLLTRCDSNEDPNELVRQERDLTFGVAMRCIAIIQYLAEHMERIHLSAVNRLYQVHDLPMLLVQIIDLAPWEKTTDDGRALKYSDGTWQEMDETARLAAAEAHAWLALHQLLLFPELGKYYNMTDFARRQLMKLERKISQNLLIQLPPLHQLKLGLLRLSTLELPAPRKQMILEIIPEIKNNLLSELSTEKNWHQHFTHHSKMLVHCPPNQVTKIAQRMCNILTEEMSLHPKTTCKNCGKPAKSRCSRCKLAWYCSRQCQVSHFKSHKQECKPVSIVE